MFNLPRRVIVAFLICAAAIATCASPSLATVRTYFIAADEVVWNYAPSGHNGITHKPLGPVARGQIGWAYKKAIYRAYTDATFQHLAPRAPADRYLGLIGPVIRAEVGDTIKLVFRNNTTLHLGVHPHGVLYKKGSEGAPYLDGGGGKKPRIRTAGGTTHMVGCPRAPGTGRWTTARSFGCTTRTPTR